jgi:hypothetical protein
VQDLKFPIGEFTFNLGGNLEEWISNISLFPSKINKITKGLTQEQVNFKYRPEGWCIKQVVHHCADSHMNSFIRFKLALTEKDAMIRPYFEDRWAELSDSLDDDITDSIALITALHLKWTKFLNTLSSEDLKIEFVHPEHGTRVSLLENIAFYSWHCEHHFAHIEQALKASVKYN